MLRKLSSRSIIFKNNLIDNAAIPVTDSCYKEIKRVNSCINVSPRKFDDTINIPDEVYEFYKTSLDEILYEDRLNRTIYTNRSRTSEKNIRSSIKFKLEEKTEKTNLKFDNIPEEVQNNKNKKVSMFYKMYNYALKYQSDLQFTNVYHHFKPYFKFFLSKIKHTVESKNSVKYFCIVDDTSIIFKSLNKLITSCKRTDIEIIKAYDGVEALALLKILT